jgi:D-alanyl-D-alanine carboxypeptidase/D-alanyl-D-alanine-endopeptidase (penicillin-binding protein 4)
VSHTEPPTVADVPGMPVRYRIAPLVGLVAIALVPLAFLVAVFAWSNAQANDHDARSSQPPDAAESLNEPSSALTTSMIAYRRAPGALAQLGSDNELAAAMEQLATFIDARSCLAVSVDGRVVGSWNGDVAVIPASTNKLLVAGVAIEVLGADSRFATSVAAVAPVDGVVDGDLYLIGGGDPMLTTTDFAAGLAADDDAPALDVITTLDVLADAVVEAGITSIRGAIVGDASRYDNEFVNPTWGPGIAFVDAGPIGALVVNNGQIVGRSGRQRNPSEAAAREFTRLLRDRGVAVSNGWDSGVSEPGVPVIATVESAPLSTIVADMLARSDNDTAEMLLKEIGVASAGEGSTAAGLQILDETVGSWGAPMDAVVFADGSGLSTANRLTCDTLVAVLDHLEKTTAVAGLAVAGRSGTLIDEFIGTPVEGNLVAKTGTLSNPPADADPPEVKALAGLVDAPNGAVVEFALVLNGAGYVTADGYLPFWDALGERLANYPAGPNAAELGPR